MGNLCAARMRPHARQCCGVSRALCCAPSRKRARALLRDLEACEIDSFVDEEAALDKQCMDKCMCQVSYDLLEIAFKPGTEVWFSVQGHKAGGHVKEALYTTDYRGEESFQLMVEVLVSDGEQINDETRTLEIDKFIGQKNIEELNVHRMTPSVKEELSKRGEKFRRFAIGQHNLQYHGIAFMNWGGCRPTYDEEDKVQFGLKTFRAEGRVMIDVPSFARYNANYGNNASHMRRYFWREEESNLDIDKGSAPALAEVPDCDLWRTWPTLKGFSFHAKRWGEMFVEALEEIQYRTEAVNALVMEGERKQMVLAMVQHASKSFTDVVADKGGGCIFLLHGPPGVGKTLTAEAVSESLRKPIYALTVGELGSTVESMEARLRYTLELAELWGAVLLIDECDIFLEKRDNSNVQRNAMTGIFLRLLEYHRGVLFLTSNRIQSFDVALYSRITVALHYPNLDASARKQVWNNMLIAAGLDASEFDMESLAVDDANGRQIKTAIRFAQIMAHSQNAPKVTTQHCHLASKLAREFNCGEDAVNMSSL